MNIRYSFHLLSLALLTLLSSCQSDFLKEYSQDMSRAQTPTDLNELMMGDCLLPLGLASISNSTYSINNPNYAVLHFLSDELQENISTPGRPDFLRECETYFPYFCWQQDTYRDYKGASTMTSSEANYWNLAYEKIDRCNMVISAEKDVTCDNDVDRALLRHVMGETHFLRATYYYMLVKLYGKPYAPQTAASTPGVPIKVSANVEDKEFQRASVADVYQQILADLDEAEKDLGDVTTPENIYHVGLDAVYIFRSRVAMYMQDWNQAADYASKALQQNNYLQTVAGWTSNTEYPISSSNKEVVFSNGASCFGNLVFAYPQRKNSSWDDPYSPAFEVSDHLMSLFSANDGRRKAYITNEDDLGYHRWSYHKIDNSYKHLGVYNTVSDVFSLRTAEAYLNLAEADAELGKDSEACQYLNKLRDSRIQNNTAVSLSGKELISFIREERERELCFEGHRWFDLRRYSIDTKYPQTTTIEHTFSTYTLVDYENKRQETRYYRLLPNDDAYTLDIPYNVRNFQKSIGSNSRPARQPFKTVAASQDEDSGDDDSGSDW